MTWTITGDVEAFRTATEGFLHARPAENTLLLTVADTLHRAGPAAFGEFDPLFGWWRRPGGAVDGACLQTPPRPMLLSSAPPGAVTALAGALAAAGHPLSGVSADPTTASVLAGAWYERTGATAKPGAHLRLYRLGELTDPSPHPAGHARPAVAADLELLVGWWEAFHTDVGEVVNRPREAVAEKIDRGVLTVWESGGQPVAMAGRSAPLAGMARVLAVYTPPRFRRRGYAGAVTVAVSRAARDAGATQVVLYTEQENRTSNALYQRLGYCPIEDRIVLSFTP